MVASAIGIAGCASYPLHANLEDAELDQRLHEHFHAGMTVDAVKSELTALRVREGDTVLYPPAGSRPEVLLARLYPPGGFWIDNAQNWIEFMDVSFVFDRSRALERWVTYRDSIRYFEGDPVKGPTREPMTRVPRYPGRPPPPVEPLEGAK